uniref:Protein DETOXIFICATION n=1 Tax=Fagus sylvatica TaxID=28930 RepID=A0A2N9IXX6_FAGSY
MAEMPLFVLFKDTRNVFRNDELGQEIMQIALPTALALTADPIASLIDTAFIGHIGPVELAAVGVSIAVFNQVSKIAIFPLVSITTSFVAEEDAAESLSTEADDNGVLNKVYATNQEMELEDLIPQVESTHKSSLITSSYRKTNDRRKIPSASAALIIGSVLGLIQALFLIFAAKPILNYMGVDSNSPMIKPAQQYLTLRSLGAPAVLLSLAMQGVFRGFKDTKTPLYATLVGDVANIILDPIFMFILDMGVSGAAVAHVISQYIISLMLLWRLMKEVDLLPPSINDLQFGRFLKNGFMLLVRVIAATFCVTLAAALAARQGSTSMAAFQVCLQIWLATSLLADGLAVAGQGGGLAVKSVVPSGLGCGGPRFESRNGKRLGLNPTIPTLDPLVPSWGWDNSYGSPVPSGPSGYIFLHVELSLKHAILASAFARKDYAKATATASRVLQVALVLGLVLSLILVVALQFVPRLFTTDINVLHLIGVGIPDRDWNGTLEISQGLITA